MSLTSTFNSYVGIPGLSISSPHGWMIAPSTDPAVKLFPARPTHSLTVGALSTLRAIGPPKAATIKKTSNRAFAFKKSPPPTVTKKNGEESGIREFGHKPLDTQFYIQSQKHQKITESKINAQAIP
jgi:hypothetical protein